MEKGKKFSQFACEYLEVGEYEGSRSGLKDLIYDLRKKITRRLEFIIPNGFEIIGEVIVDRRSLAERNIVSDESEEYVDYEQRRLYMYCSDKEYELYAFLVDNIILSNKGNQEKVKCNGMHIRKEEWEFVDNKIKMQIMKYIYDLAKERPKRWPFSEDELVDIYAKLMRPTEYRYVTRKAQIKSFFESGALVEILSYEDVDKIYRIIKKYHEYELVDSILRYWPELDEELLDEDTSEINNK